MRYLEILELEVIPEVTPLVRRNCPKCKDKSHYISTEKFRVNANRKLLDIWLIYQCSKCKSTWNMSIYERASSKNFSKDLLYRFQENDKELALSYSYNNHVLRKNQAEILWDEVQYTIHVNGTNTFSNKSRGQLYRIINPYEIPISLDKLLSRQLGVSRNKIKSMIEQGTIYNPDKKNLEKLKVYTNLIVGLIDKTVDNKEIIIDYNKQKAVDYNTNFG